VTLAAATRDAVRARPLLYDALRAGVLNHRAAADRLLVDLPGDPDPDSVATALRRFADDLPPVERAARRATVRVRRGVGPVETADPLLAVGGAALGETDGDEAALLATGDVDARALATVLARLRVAAVAVAAAGVAGDGLVVVVADGDRTAALRVVESALDAVPTG
jgi:hypothetical protein